MEKNTGHSKTNTRHLVVIGIFVLLFGAFIFFLTRPSKLNTVQNKIARVANIEDLKVLYTTEKANLGNDAEFLHSIRERILLLNPGAAQLTEIKKWLPASSQNLNIILVPDLSYRLRDTVNNPGQAEHDKMLLNIIWEEFQKQTRLKMDSKDRLLVDVADPNQAMGKFRAIADKLVFDLSEFKNRSNRLYFKKEAQRFPENIGALYQTAAEKTSGADYVYYISERLPERLKASTLEDDYRNIVIFITDGYLEVTLPDGHGKSISPNTAELRKLCGRSGLAPSPFVFPRQTMNSSYPNAEVYLFEVNERKNGQNCDYLGLKQWWSSWFLNMHFQNAQTDNIYKRQDAISNTRKQVEAIF